MFTANSMNCLCEALGMALPTNGTLLARHAAGLRRAGLDSLNISLDTLEAERYRELTRGGRIQDVLEGIEAARREGFPVKLNMVVLEDTAPQEIERMRGFCRERGLELQLINHFDIASAKSQQYLFDRPPKCSTCNKIRLLADGQLKPCLHSDQEIRLDPGRLTESLREAILAKPARGITGTKRAMSQIGG
jgi:cyclic pyranopterin phosphate synthase